MFFIIFLAIISQRKELSIWEQR